MNRGENIKPVIIREKKIIQNNHRYNILNIILYTYTVIITEF